MEAMSPSEYESIRRDRPELNLPSYWDMPLPWKHLVNEISSSRLIARRTGVLLARDFGFAWDSFDQHPLPEPE